MKNRRRADILLVEKGVVETRSKAQALILRGKVFYQTEKVRRLVDKAGDLLHENTQFEVDDPSKDDVGRGAQKLRHAFLHWPQLSQTLQNGIALDIGSSTGGFTQVLLENGARQVVALDVGSHQLHERLRADPRVISLEKTHVLKVQELDLKNLGLSLPFDMLVMDVSFISSTKVLAHAAPWLRPRGYWIVLIKPQFELEPKKVPGGVVKTDAYRQEAVERVKSFAAALSCFRLDGVIESPITGADGNVEYLLCLEKT